MVNNEYCYLQLELHHHTCGITVYLATDSKYYTAWHPQQDRQRSDGEAGISTKRTGSTMTTGMTITISIKVITIKDKEGHRN